MEQIVWKESWNTQQAQIRIFNQHKTDNMATIDYGFMGGFNGKLGTAVGYQWRGKWCVRSLAATVNPRTKKQQEHRSMFKQEVQLASRFNWALRETMGQASLERHMTPCNLFVSVNQHAFSMKDGQLETAWEQLVLSDGPVTAVGLGKSSISGDNTLEISFEKNPSHGRANGYDRVYLFVYCPEVEQGYWAAPVYRRSEHISALLPDVFAGHEVQLWAMVQDRNGQWSPTVYGGSCSSQETDSLTLNDHTLHETAMEEFPETDSEGQSDPMSGVPSAVGMQFDSKHVLWKKE